jgi:serine/threonine protein kinase
MGQVYRATDVRLGRDVAIKLLSSADRHDRDLVERFLQEARITAALDRPNIVRLFDVGIHDDRPFLVMELLEGETLRERLGHGPMHEDEIRRVALDVAHGLTAAHAAGLVHRDLKPENLFLTRSGPTKSLDFGVAKLVQASPVPGNQAATVAGMLVGTAGYLAPEQILGEAVDARADLFAFGAILYEMLTGRAAFGRAHTIDTLYAVLREPVPSLHEEPGVAPDMAAIGDRLLEKDADARFQSAADLVWALERTGAVATDASPRAHSQRSPLRWSLPAAIAAVALILAAVWLRPWPSGSSSSATADSGTPGVAQFTWRLPDEMRLASAPVVSPDGRHIAFVGMKDSRSELWIRDLASLDARSIPGTVGAVQPFWSPDSRSLAFFSNRKLLRVSLDSGAPPLALADAPDPCGGTWSQAGTIVFQPEVRESSLMRVAADGGRVQPATEFDVKSDAAHRWPAFLPDGVHFLYFVQSELDGRRGIYVGSIAEPNALAGRWLLAGESGATFVPRAGSDVGTLLTVRSSRVEARPFDARSLSLAGGVSSIALPAVDASPRLPALLGASADVLAAAATPIPFGVQLVMMSMSGERLQALTGAGLTGFPRLSPDGRRLARTAVDTVRGNADLWVNDLDRGTELRLTTGREVDVSPAWSPKGDRIAYRTGWGETHLAVVSADGTGTPLRLDCPRSPCEPTDWSIDGRGLLINAGTDVWTVPVDPHIPPSPLLSSAFVERDARYSPDGRWVAYVSDESGHVQVFIQTVTGPQRRIVVSNQGGDQPVWLSDGSALFYLDHEHLLQRVSLHPSPDGGLTLGRPERVGVPRFSAGHWGTTYAVSPDGARVVIPQAPEEQAPREITIVMGWPALLK